MRMRDLGVWFSFAWAAACGDPAVEADSPAPAAHVVALSTYESSVGSVIDVYGTNLAGPDRTRTTLIFKGEFTAAGGARTPVYVEVDPKRVDGSTLRWTSFGPYRNPFGQLGNEVGRFHGTVEARTTLASGDTLADPAPIGLSFEVLPSILVQEFQPLTASCNGAIKRAIGGASYRLRVEASGFEPVSFTYTVRHPALRAPGTAIRHLASGRFDSVGERGDFVLPEVPDELSSYGAIISVQAKDASNRTYQSAFAVSVHRPLEVYYNGNIDVAEVLPPVPVSGCIPGGESGRSVQYGESMQETRSRGFNLSWNQSWLSSHTVSAGSSETIGLSETNGIGFSTTDGTSWNWSLGAEVGGEFGLSDLVSIGVKVNGSVGGGGSHNEEQSSSRSVGLDRSTTTTETEEVSQQQGGEQGGGLVWEVSSSQSISRDFGGQVIARKYGVFYRQALRLLRRAAVVTYNQCGSANVVADLDFSDWTWSPDLAQADTCPPLPPSNLPQAACLIPPCDAS